MKAIAGSSPRSLERLRVIDVMHPGVISCPPETPLPTVARMMAGYRVHAIIVHAHETEPLPDGSLWGVISDADLMAASRAPDFEAQEAGAVSSTPALRIASADPLPRAVQLMVEHEVSHLIVVERHSERPIGVVSTLDVARALAGE